MIAVGMAYDQRVDSGDPGCAQERHDDSRARVRGIAVARPGIVDEHVVCRDRDDGKPLPDIQHRHARASMRHRRRRQQHQRQKPRRTQNAPGYAARCEQPDHARDRDGDGPRARCVRRPCGCRRRGQPFEPLHHDLQHGVRDAKQQVDRQCDRNERQRDDGERNGRDGDRVRERRNERQLPEQRQRTGHEPERYDPLCVRRLADRFEEFRASGCVRARRETSASRIQQQRDRAERQPEARRQRGPRIPREHERE